MCLAASNGTEEAETRRGLPSVLQQETAQKKQRLGEAWSEIALHLPRAAPSLCIFEGDPEGNLFVLPVSVFECTECSRVEQRYQPAMDAIGESIGIPTTLKPDNHRPLY